MEQLQDLILGTMTEINEFNIMTIVVRFIILDIVLDIMALIFANIGNIGK